MHVANKSPPDVCESPALTQVCAVDRSQVDLVPQGQTLTLLPPETAMMNFSFVFLGQYVTTCTAVLPDVPTWTVPAIDSTVMSSVVQYLLHSCNLCPQRPGGSPTKIFRRLSKVSIRIPSRLEAIAIRLEAIASRLEAIASWLEACRLEAIAIVSFEHPRLIYARSALAEQTTPSYLALVDEAPVVFNISLEDLAFQPQKVQSFAVL